MKTRSKKPALMRRPLVERRLSPQEKTSIIATALRHASTVLDVTQHHPRQMKVRLRDYADEIFVEVLK